MRLTQKAQLTSGDLYRMEIDCELEEVAGWHNKLSRLEDIEEELGIDLDILFKGAFDGIWFIPPSKDSERKEILDGWIDLGTIDKMEHSFCVGNKSLCCLSFKDYGKTWALTKEELL